MNFSTKDATLALIMSVIINSFCDAQTISDSSDVQPSPPAFMIVEVAAQPEGGMTKFYKFIGENIRYPKLARQSGIEGKVFVEFIVESDGTVTEVAVIKGIGGGCDEEAVRVVSLSPKWIPGTQDGKAVRQKMVLPLSFSIPWKNRKR